MVRLYTVTEVARILSVHRETIRRWIKKGSIKATKVENFYLISQDEVDRLKETLVKDKWDLFRSEMQRLEISRLYTLCANEKFDEIASELNLSEQPKNVRECYKMVRRTLNRA
jgi:excisionase family DNA binding protein